MPNTFVACTARVLQRASHTELLLLPQGSKQWAQGCPEPQHKHEVILHLWLPRATHRSLKRAGKESENLLHNRCKEKALLRAAPTFISEKQTPIFILSQLPFFFSPKYKGKKDLFPETNFLSILKNESDKSLILSKLQRGDKIKTSNNSLIQKTGDFYWSC